VSKDTSKDVAETKQQAEERLEALETLAERTGGKSMARLIQGVHDRLEEASERKEWKRAKFTKEHFQYIQEYLGQQQQVDSKVILG